MPGIHSERILSYLKDDYSHADVERLLNEVAGEFVFPSLPTGFFSSVIPDDSNHYTGYQNVWVRDNVHIGFAHYTWGDKAVAIRIVRALLEHFALQTGRFKEIIQGHANKTDPQQRPHIRFDGTTLQDLPEKWPHDQNDALGYFLWLTCLLVKNNDLELTEAEWQTVALFPPYFKAIEYWLDKDSGHWEEAGKIQASSIGTVVAGLQQLKQLVDDGCAPLAVSSQAPLIDSIFEEGILALNQTLPWECRLGDMNQLRRYDSALLFLIYPLGFIEGMLAGQIVDDVKHALLGMHGIRRYIGDSFWCGDYRELVPEKIRTSDFSDTILERDALLKKGEEAQWCLFDPILSIIYGNWFKNGGNEYDRRMQIWHLNRSLAQLVEKNGKLCLPELYFKEKGHYVENDVIPLLWSQAYLKVALQEMLANSK
jgi:hypothetical protein